MPIFPLDEEERRRAGLPPPPPIMLPNIPTKRPRMALPMNPPDVVRPETMPGAPLPSPFPETAMPRPLPMPTRGAPESTPSPMPSLRPPPSRYEQMQEAKGVYLQGTPGRPKSGLLGAARGALLGLGSGQGLAGVIGGALAGGTAGAINPRGLRTVEFNQQVRPEIEERFRYEDADRAMRIQAAKAAADQAMNEMQLANMQSQINDRNNAAILARSKEEREANAPFVLNPGQVAVDKRTRQEVFRSPALPKPPTRDELTIEPESGKSFEEIAEDSYQSRGGDSYVFSKLPARTQQLLNGQITDANPAEVAAANRAFQDAINRQRKADLDYTRGDVRARALGSRQGGGAKPIQRKSQPGRSAISLAEAADLLK